LISERKWYKQATNAKFSYIYAPAIGVFSRIKSENYIFARDAKYFEGFYIEKYLDSKAREIIEIQKKDPEFIDRALGKAREVQKKFDEYFINFPEIDSIDEAKKQLAMLYELMKVFWYHVFICDVFDPSGEEILQEEISSVDFLPGDLLTLLRKNKLSYIQEERLELLRFRKGEKIDMGVHAKKYFFIDNSWESVKRLGESDFLKKAEELIDIDSQISDLTIDLYTIHNDLLDKYHLSDEQIAVIRMFRELIFYRDERKEYVLKTNHYIEKIHQFLAKHFSISEKLASLIALSDLDNFNLEDVKARENIVMYTSDDKLTTGEKATAVYNELVATFPKKEDFIKGQVAYPGDVSGTVRVVMGESHFGKLEEGDILVAPMTRPEYIPIIRRAKAIITDEGGVTCHASIVSRELRIPCVVGTKIATRIFSDGDNISIKEGVIRRVK